MGALDEKLYMREALCIAVLWDDRRYIRAQLSHDIVLSKIVILNSLTFSFKFHFYYVFGRTLYVE